MLEHILLHLFPKQISRSRKARGVVADFCPICRKIRKFRFIEVFKKTPLSSATFTPSQLSIEHFIRCTECSCELETQRNRYSNIEKDRTSSEAVLVNKTFPKIHVFYKDRLDMEARLRRSPESLSASERQDLLLEPFCALSPAVDVRFESGMHFDLWASVGCLGTVGITIGIFLFGLIYWAGTLGGRDRVLITAASAGAIGTIFTLFQLYLSDRRYLNRRIVAQLVQSMGPLKPTRGELEACLSSTQFVGHVIGEKLKCETVWLALQKNHRR